LQRPGQRLERVLVATVVVLLLATAVPIVDERFPLAIFHGGLDLVFHTVATLITGAVARLAYLRFRERGQTTSLFQAAGLLVLCAMNALNGMVILSGRDIALGFSLASPGQLPLYLWALARLISTALLVAGAVVAVRTFRPIRRDVRLVVLLPLAVLAVLSIVVLAARSQLPPLLGPVALEWLGASAETRQPLPGLSAGMVLLDGSAAVLLLTGAFLYRRRYRSGGSISDGFLAIGLVVAAFSQVHFVLYPAIFTGLVSTGDVLRVAFYGALFMGIQAEARQDLRELRSASARVERLRETELEAAALLERGRLARELHDGLAQDLWSAKLELVRLGERLNLDADARAAFDRLGTALTEALDEARTAVMTLRGGFTATSVADELGPFLRDVAERWGLQIEYQATPALRTLPIDAQGELLRMVQEAVNNAVKHADATVLRVRAAVDAGLLVVAVTDNGKGFEVESVVGRGVGLDSMRERALLIGARISVESEPGGGTRVEILIPLDPRP
jgi:signal transduction histidine kinase